MLASAVNKLLAIYNINSYYVYWCFYWLDCTDDDYHGEYHMCIDSIATQLFAHVVLIDGMHVNMYRISRNIDSDFNSAIWWIAFQSSN